MKVLHATISHGHLDDRVHFREAVSLARAGHDVSVIAMGPVPQNTGTVRCICLDGGSVRDRLRHLSQLLESEKADLIHIHEPHSLRTALRWADINRASVIYDVHEDFPALIRTFSRRNALRKMVTSLLMSIYEKRYSRLCDAVVTVTPLLTEKFRKLNTSVAEIRNYPVPVNINEAAEGYVGPELWPGAGRDTLKIIYTGQISGVRNLELALDTVEYLNEKLGVPALFHAVGPGDREDVDEFRKMCDNSPCASYSPPRPHPEIYSLLRTADLGWNVLPLNRNFKHALPNKSFEYCQAGIPFIASDMTLLREAVVDYGAGIMIDRLEAAVAANRIKNALEADHGLTAMKAKAVSAYRDHYRWESQESVLLELYRSISEKRI